MAAPTLFSSVKQFVGVAKETTPGTPVAMTATIPVEKFEPEDKPVWLEDAALRGSMGDLFDLQQGPLMSEISMSGPAYADTIPWLLANILGDVTTTGASAPYTHAIALLNSGAGQPTTHTLVDVSGLGTNQGRAYSGAVCTELTLKWNAESALVTYDSKWLAWPSQLLAATPTAAPSTITALPSWRMKVGLAGPASGGTLVSTAIEGELAIKRNAAVRWTGQASQNPFAIIRGKLGADVKQRFIAQDESQLLYLLNNTQPQLQWLIAGPGAGAAATSIQVDAARAAYKVAKINRGQEEVEFDTEASLIHTSTNAGTSGGLSALKVTVQNAVAASTYN